MIKITANLVKKLRKYTGSGIIECKNALIESNGNIELAISNMRKIGLIKAKKKSMCNALGGVIKLKISSCKKFGVLLELNCETDFVSRNTMFLEFGDEILNYVIEKRLLNVENLSEAFEEKRIDLVRKVGENINIRRVSVLRGNNVGFYLHHFRIGTLVSFSNVDDEFSKNIAMHITASNPRYVTSRDIPEDVLLNERKIYLDLAKKFGKNEKIIENIVEGKMKKFIEEISLYDQKYVLDPEKIISSILRKKNVTIFDFIRFELGEVIC